MPEGVVYWPRENALLIADLHLGKAATFQAASLGIPLGETDHSLQRLSMVINRLNPKRLIVLGDLWHAPAGMTGGTLEAFAEWRSRHLALEINLVLGNHDRRIDKVLHAVTGLDALPHLVVEPFHFCHEPCKAERYSLGGHLHPGVRLQGAGRQNMTLRCFWFTEGFGVLPAFGSFTGLSVISPQSQDQVYVLAGRA